MLLPWELGGREASLHETKETSEALCERLEFHQAEKQGHSRPRHSLSKGVGVRGAPG